MKKIVLATSLTVASLLAGDSLTVISFGGSYGAAQKQHMIDPYVKATGTKVFFDNYKGGTAEIKAQVQSGSVNWDVIDIEYVDLEKACSENLLEKLNPSFLPNGDDGVTAVNDFQGLALNECAIGNIFWGTVFAYNDKYIGAKKPTTLNDLFDLKKFPGKRGLKKRAQINLEWALIADGVDPKNVYDILETEAGVERAFKKLATIKDSVVWFDSWSQAPQLLNDGSVMMAQAANGRLNDFNVIWDGQAYDLDGWAIIKGTKNLEKAKEFIAFATSTIPLAGMKDVNYGPTRKSSNALLTKAEQNKLPTAHLDEGFKVNGEFWADFGTELNEKFNAWLLKD
ncbi:MAG: putative spermidine/putrescine transport system substrate-binding protein [Arcobacteraceae bacterium]|jgi:putative spermidine/putrescine transport system substrate-binding protein